MKIPVLRMREKAILRVVARMFIPFILLFALYVQFHGDFGPGGGFQAGVIFAAGFVLYGLIFGLDSLEKVVPFEVLEVGVALGLLLFAGVGISSLVLGGNYLDYRVFSPEDPEQALHLGILLVELGVGIAVAGAMLIMFYAFAGRRVD